MSFPGRGRGRTGSGPDVLEQGLELLPDLLGCLDLQLAPLGLRRPDLHVIAAGRADALRTNFGHWTVEVRRSRQGLALRPEDMDTELWNVSLPRHRPAHLDTGRGYLVADGRAELTQGARP